MNKLQIVKTVSTTIVAVGTGKIVSSIIENNTNPETVTDVIAIKVGSFAIGGMIADVTAKYTNAKIDQIATQLTELKEKFNEARKK